MPSANARASVQKLSRLTPEPGGRAASSRMTDPMASSVCWTGVHLGGGSPEPRCVDSCLTSSAWPAVKPVSSKMKTSGLELRPGQESGT